MSSEWRSTTLGEICQFAAGSGFTPDYQGCLSGEHPFIKVSDMNLPGNEVFIRSANNFVSDTQRQEMKAKLHPSSATVFAKIGVALTTNRRRLLTRPTIIDNNMMSASAIDREATPRFLYFLLTSLDFNTIAAGTALPYLNVSDLRRLSISIPSLDTQVKIELLLGVLDDRIALLRQTNATLEAIAQALFKSWFVDFDPVRAKQQGHAPAGMDEATAALFPARLETSALGPVPKGWRVGALGDLAQVVKTQVQPSVLDSSIKYVGMEHVPRKSLSLVNWGTAVGLESAKAKFDAGDVLFGKLRPYFHKVVIAPFSGVCSTDILVCQAKQDGYYGLAVMHLFSTSLVDYADRLSNGAKMPRIGWADIAAYPLVIPSLDVATSYALATAPMLERMKANVFQAKTLSTLRDTLLPRLISGRLRMPETAEAST